jgi:hypothetical protein
VRTRLVTSVATVIAVLTVLTGLLFSAVTMSAQDVATPVASAPEQVVPHPAHIHFGTCETLGDVVYPLADVTPVNTGVAPDAQADLQATPVASPTVEATDIVVAESTTTVDNVRIRAEPNTDADILLALPVATQLEITGGPEEADEYTWYEVEVVNEDETVIGWVASDFLEVVGEPAE